MSRIVGIDLGTTNSAVARVNEYGRPEIVPNRDGTSLTPSMIYFGSHPPAVGLEAREFARLGHDQIASVFKPHMGNPHYRLRFDGLDYDATDLSAIVLRRLKEDAESALGEAVDRAVITVPAYFADPQRTATMAAGRAAGLEVVRILNEPTAAALAYGSRLQGPDQRVLIYDLGGGTFDVTVAVVTGETLEVLATAGDHDLGGKNWDDRIATHLAEQFERDTGIDPLDDPISLHEVLTLAERSKWQLSDRQSTRVSLQIQSERRAYELTRETFESLTFPLMDRTRLLTEEALVEAGLDWKRLDGVLLVGGSTRMPMVRRYVTEMAGRPPRSGVNVDEVVALGAAIQAELEDQRSGRSRSISNIAGTAGGPRFTLPSPTRIRDVMSHSLGVVAVSQDGTCYVNDIIIRRNQPIPAENTRQYLHETHGGRNDRLEVFLTQGESADPLDCTILGKYAFHGIAVTDSQVLIDVNLSYDVNGVVQVKAIQRDTLKSLPMSVETLPADLTWLGRPPVGSQRGSERESIRVVLLIDVSASMTGEPLFQAQAAAREFLQQCDLDSMEVGLVAFSDVVALLAEPTSDIHRLNVAIGRLEPGGSTNLTDALGTATEILQESAATRYVVLLTDGYPDAPESAVERAEIARAQGIEIVAIGTGLADVTYLRRLASSEAGSIFARQGELVRTFGHIARVIAEGGRSLRTL